MPLENSWRARKVRGSNLLLNREVGCESNLLSWICLTTLATFAEQTWQEEPEKDVAPEFDEF